MGRLQGPAGASPEGPGMMRDAILAALDRFDESARPAAVAAVLAALAKRCERCGRPMRWGTQKGRLAYYYCDGCGTSKSVPKSLTRRGGAEGYGGP